MLVDSLPSPALPQLSGLLPLLGATCQGQVFLEERRGGSPRAQPSSNQIRPLWQPWGTKQVAAALWGWFLCKRIVILSSPWAYVSASYQPVANAQRADSTHKALPLLLW